MLRDGVIIDNTGQRHQAQFSMLVTDVGSGSRVDLSMTTPVRCLNRVVFETDIHVTEILEHGFQSWSTVRRCTPDDVRPVRAQAPRWFRGQMLADRDAAGVDLAGDTFLIYDNGVVGFLSARQSFGSLRVTETGMVEVHWILDDVVVDVGSEIVLDSLWLASGDAGALYSEYATLSGREMSVRAPRPLQRTWCSWYQYFDRVTPSDIRENLDLAVAHDLEVIQIDDGWQREIGVWTDVNSTFGEPLNKLAHEITSRGLVAGIWTAPFLAIEGGSLHRDHDAWLVQNPDGAPTTALVHAGWGGKIFALDLTNPEVIDHIVSVYRHLFLEGFRYFKIDFCHAGAAVGVRRDPSKTRAQALRRGLQAVRDGIGDESYLVGCGCPLLSAVGIVDAMRVSEDVATFYEPRQFFEGFEESAVSARNAIEASVLRAPLHRRWFTADPDCVLLRTTETELTKQQREVIGYSALATSGFIVLSDRLALYDDSTWANAAQLFDAARDVERDIVDPFSNDLTIQFGDESITINWDDQRAVAQSQPHH